MNHWSALLECPRHYDPVATAILTDSTIEELRELRSFYRLRMGMWEQETTWIGSGMRPLPTPNRTWRRLHV